MASPNPITIDRIRGFAVSVRPSVGPVSSLGDMPVRNGLLIEVSAEGSVGWGEVWCNFPPRGNLARMHLFEDIIAPRLIGASFAHYSDCRLQLEAEMARIMIHTGEFGPFAHCFSGIDTALADIAAQRVGQPLCTFLSGLAVKSVPVYASTPDVRRLDAAMRDILEAGHSGIKLKIGLGLATDLALLKRMRELGGAGLHIMADANQNWTVPQAANTINALAEFEMGFVEEPLRADAPLSDWAALAADVDIPLAGGENITSFEAFSAFVDKGKMSVVQPDVAKWGGISGALDVGRMASGAGAICAMHYMGTAVGLAASIHALAAIGGTGPVELDANPNPLRTDLGQIDLDVTNGRVSVPNTTGIGFVPDMGSIRAMCVGEFEIT